ncbi:MAG: hypothetical protein ACRC62_10310 [Microcoleus sp.]
MRRTNGEIKFLLINSPAVDRLSNVLHRKEGSQMYNIHTNIIATFNQDEAIPEIDLTAYVHPLAAVIGNVHLGRKVMVAPAASVRGDEGQPIWIGDFANVQDCVVIHALETHVGGAMVQETVVEVEGEFYGVYISDRVSLAHQCQVHGPAKIGFDTFIGMQSMVFKAEIGNNCVLEPKVLVMGVTVPDGRYVPAGSSITTQEAADNLPVITDNYPLRNLNKNVVHVNIQLASGYREKEMMSVRIPYTTVESCLLPSGKR